MKLFFDASTMGAQLKMGSGMPLVDCESCHGPGSLAIKDLSKDLVESNSKLGLKTPCDFKTLIDLKNLPATAQSLVCLKCHSANATFNPAASTVGWVCVPNNNSGSVCTLSIGSLAAGGTGSATFAVTFLLAGLVAASLLQAFRNLAGIEIRPVAASETFAGGRIAFTLAATGGEHWREHLAAWPER